MKVKINLKKLKKAGFRLSKHHIIPKKYYKVADLKEKLVWLVSLDGELKLWKVDDITFVKKEAHFLELRTMTKLEEKYIKELIANGIEIL